jgi:DNA polymerase (family 10)
MELDWRWQRRALELGCLLSINPDAHSIRELELVRWDVGIARKGGVTRGHVLNAMGLAQLMRHLQRRKDRQTGNCRDRNAAFPIVNKAANRA